MSVSIKLRDSAKENRYPLEKLFVVCSLNILRQFLQRITINGFGNRIHF